MTVMTFVAEGLHAPMSVLLASMMTACSVTLELIASLKDPCFSGPFTRLHVGISAFMAQFGYSIYCIRKCVLG